MATKAAAKKQAETVEQDDKDEKREAEAVVSSDGKVDLKKLARSGFGFRFRFGFGFGFGVHNQPLTYTYAHANKCTPANQCIHACTPYIIPVLSRALPGGSRPQRSSTRARTTPTVMSTTSWLTCTTRCTLR